MSLSILLFDLLLSLDVTSVEVLVRLSLSSYPASDAPPTVLSESTGTATRVRGDPTVSG